MRPLALFAFAALIAGCVSPRSGTEPDGKAAFPPPFTRAVYPFEVRDADGRPYTHPLLGGLNAPRPQLIDIDGDGDDDLFLQEAADQIMFFEQVGSAEEPRYLWRTDRFEDLDVGEWYRFADLDDDGDVDLLAEQRFSYIRAYLNEGSPTRARFTTAVDTLRDAAGLPIFSDRQNIPNLIDLDCDGLLDLFIGRVQGTVHRYESVGADEQGLPRFELVTDRFEDIEIIGQFGTLHGANTLTFGDVDRDGDPDLFWGDFFEPGLLLIENTGTCARPALRSEPVPFPRANPISSSGYNAPALTDRGADGDLDLVVGVLGGAFNPNHTASDNLYLYEHTADGAFALRTSRLIDGIDVGSESFPAFADLDADGDLDLLLSNKIDPADNKRGHVFLFENQGTAAAPAFQLTDTLALAPSFHYAPAFGDLDADGDLDALLGTWNKNMALYRNEGSATEPRFVEVNPAYLELSRGSNSTPALIDIDGDGDLDVFAGEASGTLNFYRNEGTPEQARFVLETDEYAGIDIGRRSVPVFADLDTDGDPDLIVGTESNGLIFFRNQGRPGAPAFVADSSFALPLPAYATPAFTDIDADGDLDVFSGGIGGGLLFFENRSVTPSPSGRTRPL